MGPGRRHWSSPLPSCFPILQNRLGSKVPKVTRGVRGQRYGLPGSCADGLPVGCNAEVTGGHVSIHVTRLRHNTCEILALKCVTDREAITQGDRSVCRRLGSGWEGDSWGGGSPARKCPREERHGGCALAGGAAHFQGRKWHLLEVTLLSVTPSPQASR